MVLQFAHTTHGEECNSHNHRSNEKGCPTPESINKEVIRHNRQDSFDHPVDSSCEKESASPNDPKRAEYGERIIVWCKVKVTIRMEIQGGQIDPKSTPSTFFKKNPR